LLLLLLLSCFCKLLQQMRKLVFQFLDFIASKISLDG
jgi:hypothetical protein